MWFIFTICEDSSELLHGLEDSCPILHVEQPDLRDVFCHHVDSYYPGDLFPDENQRLRNLLIEMEHAFEPPCTAPILGSLFSRYGSDPTRLMESIMHREYVQGTTSLHDWFEGLPNLNYILYALIVALFRDLDKDRLDLLYETSVARLRNIGLDGDGQFVDPRRIAGHVLDAKLYLMRNDHRTNFVDDKYCAAAELHIKDYQRLLWLFVDELVAYIREATRDLHAARRQLRIANDRLMWDPENSLLIRQRSELLQEIAEQWHIRNLIAAAIARSPCMIVKDFVHSWMQSHVTKIPI